MSKLCFSLVVLTLFSASALAVDLPQLQPPAQTSGCVQLQGKKSYMDVDYAMAVRLFYSDNLPVSQQFKFHIDPDKLYCYKNHETHSIQLFESKEILGEVEIELTSPPFKMRSMWGETKGLLNKYPDLMGFVRIIRQYINLNFPDVTDDDPIQLMALGKIHKSNTFLNAYTSVTPQVHRFAKTLDYEATAKFVATEKPFIIDTRPDGDFKMWHLPNAHNFHVLMNSMLPGTPFDERNYIEMQAFVPLSQLPKDKKAPILLMGYSLKDSAAYYLAMMLNLANYRNLYWYRGGREDWLRVHRVLPDGKLPADVPVIAWTDLETSLNKVNLVSVQRLPQYRMGHILGAVNNLYYAPNIPPPVGELSEWTFNGDNWNIPALPQDKSKPLVIVGLDETDWTAVIATKRAIALGYKASWYKGGSAEWLSLKTWFGPERFPVATGNAAK